MSTLEPDPADVLEFFKNTIPDQIHLTAITHEIPGAIVARDFGGETAAATDWAVERNLERYNVYFSVNRVREGVSKKPSKADIVGLRFAHIDVDPPKGAASFTMEQGEAARDRLHAAKPSIVIWSGNGFQALWRLPEGVDAAEAEEINRGLIEALGGDVGTHDVSRLLRVPGLINWPNAQKRQIGRQPKASLIFEPDDGSIADPRELLAQFPSAPTSRGAAVPPLCSVHLGDVALLTADALQLAGDHYLRRLIERPKGEDRSADTFRFACEALRQGLTDREVAGVLLNAANAISAHCLDQNDPKRAATRAIEAALRDDEVREAARRHERERERKLAAEGGPDDVTKIWSLESMLRDCVFIEDGSQVADTARRGSVLSLSDFRTSTAASTMAVDVPTLDGGHRTKRKRVADVWLEHPDRRTVATQTFKAGAGIIADAPDGRSALNSWRGFRTITPPEDWQIRAQPLVDHIEWLFGDQSALLLDWLAHAMQRPGELPSIAFIHIAPKTGMGRNLISSVIGRTFVGYAALSYNLGASLRSGFNGLLAGKVFAVVDEIEEGGSNRKYQLQQDLKQLVTEETRTINPKFGRQHVEWNACRWLIFSNSEVAIPLEDADRRFVVVRCDDDPKPDEYYRHMYHLRDDPAFVAAFADYLRQRDISSFNAGMRAPMTKAKQSLLERCRSEAEQILLEIAQRWPVDVITSEEINEALGPDQPSSTAKRHMLDRAGMFRLRDWKGICQFGLRSKIIAYAVRNGPVWQQADITALRAEIARADKAEKEKALYGPWFKDSAVVDPSDSSDTRAQRL